MRQRQASRCVMQAAAVGALPRGGARAERAASARQKFSVHSALPPVVRNARHDRKRGAGKLPSGSWGARARVRRAVRAVPCGLCSAVLCWLCSALLCWLCSALLCWAVLCSAVLCCGGAHQEGRPRLHRNRSSPAPAPPRHHHY
jgi:hypothetical protein